MKQRSKCLPFNNALNQQRDRNFRPIIVYLGEVECETIFSFLMLFAETLVSNTVPPSKMAVSQQYPQAGIQSNEVFVEMIAQQEN